jgi:hypothetical protein
MERRVEVAQEGRKEAVEQEPTHREREVKVDQRLRKLAISGVRSVSPAKLTTAAPVT